MPTKRSSKSVDEPVKVLATFSGGIYLVQRGEAVPEPLKPCERTQVLVRKLGRAIKKPGISKAAVFGDGSDPKVYSYSIDPTDPTRLVRESASGKKVVGRMVGGRFRASRAKVSEHV